MRYDVYLKAFFLFMEDVLTGLIGLPFPNWSPSMPFGFSSCVHMISVEMCYFLTATLFLLLIREARLLSGTPLPIRSLPSIPMEGIGTSSCLINRSLFEHPF
jgi:hypothetical protein